MQSDTGHSTEGVIRLKYVIPQTNLFSNGKFFCLPGSLVPHTMFILFDLHSSALLKMFIEKTEGFAVVKCSVPATFTLGLLFLAHIVRAVA